MRSKIWGFTNQSSQSIAKSNLLATTQPQHNLEYAGQLEVTHIDNKMVRNVLLATIVFLGGTVGVSFLSAPFNHIFIWVPATLAFIVVHYFSATCHYRFTDAQGEISDGETDLLRSIIRMNSYPERNFRISGGICEVVTNTNIVLARAESNSENKKSRRTYFPKKGDLFEVYVGEPPPTDSLQSLILASVFGRFQGWHGLILKD